MNERLPRSYNDILASSIWDLGRAGMKDIIRIAPVPSRVKGEIPLPGKVMEPEFLIRDLENKSLDKMPKEMSLIISEIEEYEADPGFQIYSYQKLDLNTVKHQRQYNTGVVIMDTSGNMITPELSMPAPNTAYRPGSLEWRDLKERLQPRFSRLTVEYFLSSIDEAVSLLNEVKELEDEQNSDEDEEI